jgi:NADP-dependent 3-hydroxy acid dehydrogenase YdfG
MNGWSEALRQELQPDIRVTVIEPGAVATELTDHIARADTKRATEAFIKDLAIQPEDIAEIIAFAVSRPRRMALNEILVRPTPKQLEPLGDRFRPYRSIVARYCWAAVE